MKNFENRLENLKAFLINNGDYTSEEVQGIEFTEGHNSDSIEFDGVEYLVLTDEEATVKATEEIENYVWTFNSHFLISWIDCLDYDNASEKVLEAIQEQCENGNKAMLELIGDNFEDFAADAISCDGRGHFLSLYDGEEQEHYNSETDETWYIYRIN